MLGDLPIFPMACWFLAGAVCSWLALGISLRALLASVHHAKAEAETWRNKHEAANREAERRWEQVVGITDALDRERDRAVELEKQVQEVGEALVDQTLKHTALVKQLQNGDVGGELATDAPGPLEVRRG